MSRYAVLGVRPVAPQTCIRVRLGPASMKTSRTARTRAIDLLDPLTAVEENRVDREVHEHHVDSAAGIDPHASAWVKPLSEHQSNPAAEHGARHLELVGEHLAASFVHSASSIHDDRLA